jgi:nitrogen regulatory protein PII
MNYSKVTAIFNTTDYGLLSDDLAALDIPGVSVSKVMGFGDYVNEFADFGFSENMKIEIFTTTEQARDIALLLTERGNEMTEGGGVVAIEPVTDLFNVKKLNPT